LYIIITAFKEDLTAPVIYDCCSIVLKSELNTNHQHFVKYIFSKPSGIVSHHASVARLSSVEGDVIVRSSYCPTHNSYYL